MKKLKLVLSGILICLTLPVCSQDARDILNSTIEAMGGDAKWRSLQYVQMKHAGHKYWLEQSENPNGPFITSYDVSDELRGIWDQKLFKKESSHHFQVTRASENEVVVNGPSASMKFGDRSFPMPYQFRIQQDEWLRYAPEQLVFNALNPTLKQLPEEVVEGTPHLVLTYQHQDLSHTLYVNKYTRVLTQAIIDSYQPYDIFNYPWGKFKTTIKFSLHWLYPGNIRYPSQWDVYKLGKHYRSITIYDITFLSETDEKVFEISADLPPTPDPVLVDESPLKTDGLVEVAKNIYTIPGMWYVGHIVQEDGIFILEGPISSGYNRQHIDYLKKTYPDKPIKGVLASSDAWPHVGGIREYAAQEVPVYTQQLNREIIQKILDSDFSINPDSYQRNPKEADLRLIQTKVKIEDPTTPIELIPVNGEGGERMVMAYFPKQKVLYASDLIQFTGRKRDRFFSPQYLTEVKKIVDMHSLEVETVFAMHTSPIPWQQVETAIANHK